MDAPEAWGKIAGNHILKRAIEIAILGDHVITIMGHPDNGSIYAKEILGEGCHSLPYCPCGNFGDIVNVCRCLTREIMRYRNQMYASEVIAKAEMFVETFTPNWSDYQRSGESFQQMLKRTKQAVYPASLNLDQNSQALLGKAIESFGLRMRQVHNLIAVAHTIAALSCAKEIAIEHVAEAIQYQRPWGNF